MPRGVCNDVREIVLKVKEFMELEKQMQTPIIPLSKVNSRVSAATGLSERTILNISREQRLIEQGLMDPTAVPIPKKRVRTKGRIELKDYDLHLIQSKVHEFYTYKKEVPTVNKLLEILRHETDFKGSRETLRKILRSHGIQFGKARCTKDKAPQPPQPEPAIVAHNPHPVNHLIPPHHMVQVHANYVNVFNQKHG